jgi:Zn-dependent protease
MHWSVPVLVVLLGFGLGRETLPSWTPGRSGAVYTAASAVGALLLMASLLLHEAAHAAAARSRGIPVEDVTLWAMGGLTRMGRAKTAPVALLVAVSGPLTSLALAGLALGAGFGLRALAGWGVPTALLLWLGWANALLGVFNLLPAAPLDGGRVLHAVLWWRTGDSERSERVADRSGQVIGMLFIVLGWIAFVRGSPDGLWLALIGFFMAVTAGAEHQRATLTTALRGVRASEAMSSPVTTGPDWLSVERFIDAVAVHARHTALPLLDFNGALSGMVSMRQLATVPGSQRETRRVREVATPLSQCAVAAPEEQLSDVLERVRPGVGMRILVVDQGQLKGIITAHDIDRLVRGYALSRPVRA